ncbi:MAG: bifunctional heptose 7-phosphate kinase/heptose 1-phosphate adenyltransferase, partial [Alphaproteobacteria bacterium]|nr:bifunctional heptose 7-phosphate kinase/heptose 1-phosphate adenyltransferase [Alphaproteobacteria bacterium]
LSDYNKGTLTKEVCQMVIKNANQEGIKVIVDPKGPNYTKYNGAFLVKPNLKEFSESTGVKFNTESPLFKEELKEAAKIFFAKYQVQNLVVTLSEKGMACFSREYINNMVHVPTIAKEVFDVSGAGDTSLAVLGAAFALNTPQIAALTLANTASGIAVSKLGTASVTPEELTEALNEAEKNTPSSGVITLEQAVKIRENLRKVGKTVGFTNGCFDCLHLGHLHSFNEAKKECDILFVGINSDTSVKRLKGPARPLQDEQTRAGLLSALKMINYVIIFDEDTALPLIEALKPDVIAKEGYALKDWPEAQLVIKQGGRAVTLKRLEGYSTTSMVERMKNYD